MEIKTKYSLNLLYQAFRSDSKLIKEAQTDLDLQDLAYQDQVHLQTADDMKTKKVFRKESNTVIL